MAIKGATMTTGKLDNNQWDTILAVTPSSLFVSSIKNWSRVPSSKSSLKIVKRMIFALGARKIDYIKVLDVNKLIKPFKKEKKYKIFIAYYLGSTRLIDNI